MKIKRFVFLLLGFVVLAVFTVAVVFSWLHKTNGEIESSGRKRTYLLFIPESYKPDTPTPLVISLHGYMEWPAHQMDISQWNRVAEENGFIIVYPTGTGFPLRWNSHGLLGVDSEPWVDVVFISDLIDKLQVDYNIDPARVYANGFSNGGGMSFVLACRLADRIAAIGTVAGAFSFPMDECSPSRPIPVIAFHGTDDGIVPYEGGEVSSTGHQFPAVRDWVRGWALRNGCEAGPFDLPASGEVNGIKYSDCRSNADVHFYTIQGGGHSWPGGEPMPKFIVGHTSQDIDAASVIWTFFDYYALDDE